MQLNKIHTGDNRVILKSFADKSVNCIVTSPPYYGLRDYGTAKWDGGDENCSHTYHVTSPYNKDFNERYGNATGQKKQENQRHDVAYKNECGKCGAVRIDQQIGLEETPEAYISTMVDVFTECKRVLKDDGTLWLNIGDSYCHTVDSHKTKSEKQKSNKGADWDMIKRKFSDTIKTKDLIGIPWMLAFALRSSGWYLRQDIIWHKPNPMPESVTDRCTKAHEYIFLLSKSAKYYYDNEAIKVDAMYDGRKDTMMKGSEKYKDLITPNSKPNSFAMNGHERWQKNELGEMVANKRSVWTITTKPFSEAHFATFPEDLIVDCIKAGCPENGIVLDPFMGAGTTALVAAKLNRNFIGVELNPEYVKIAETRLQKELGMFNPLVA
jgi:DNA modification methylase